MTFDKQEMWQQIREESYSYTDYPDSSISQLFDEIGRLEKQVADAEARAEKAEAKCDEIASELSDLESAKGDLFDEATAIRVERDRAREMVERLSEAGTGMYDRICALYEDRHIGDMPKGHDDWEVLVAEWQAPEHAQGL